MRRWAQFFFCIFFFWFFALSGYGQSRLNFPRVLSAQELSTTGFAFVNTSPSTVVATLSFYGNDGVLAGQAPLTVPAKGQVAKLASEIASNVNRSAWVQVSSPHTDNCCKYPNTIVHKCHDLQFQRQPSTQGEFSGPLHEWTGVSSERSRDVGG